MDSSIGCRWRTRFGWNCIVVLKEIVASGMVSPSLQPRSNGLQPRNDGFQDNFEWEWCFFATVIRVFPDSYVCRSVFFRPVTGAFCYGD